MADIFMSNLNMPTFYTIPKFRHDKVLFYPKEPYRDSLVAYRTYMGDIIVKSGLAQFLYSHDMSLSYFDPTKTDCEVMLRNRKADFPRKRSVYFKNILETVSFLYNDTYEEIVKQETKKRNIPDAGGHHQMMSDLHAYYKTESRIPVESCTIWLKDHDLLDWY
jgi:hypothetical protein